MAKIQGDGRKNNGGKRENSGRKPKIEEQSQQNIFIEAVKKITSQENEDQAKIDLLVELWDTQRGKIFISEHLFGKPKEQVEVTNKNEFPDLSNITTDELQRLLNEENDDETDN
tara:strand:+ start:179 stop:520 length:342 start_codon:yes stop_codon:yes gene_type:complete